MDIKTYIESGILELYVSGLLKDNEKAEVVKNIHAYPELAIELKNIQLSMERYAASRALSPGFLMKEKILGTISNLEKERAMDLYDLPLINKFSDHTNWLRLVGQYIPEQLENGRLVRILRSTSKVTQVLLVSSTDFDDEVHSDLHESFLILQGKCRCTVGGNSFDMEAGDYTEIPLFEMHSVKIINAPVVAVLQRVPVSGGG